MLAKSKPYACEQVAENLEDAGRSEEGTKTCSAKGICGCLEIRLLYAQWHVFCTALFCMHICRQNCTVCGLSNMVSVFETSRCNLISCHACAWPKVLPTVSTTPGRHVVATTGHARTSRPATIVDGTTGNMAKTTGSPSTATGAQTTAAGMQTTGAGMRTTGAGVQTTGAGMRTTGGGMQTTGAGTVAPFTCSCSLCVLRGGAWDVQVREYCSIMAG